MLRAGAGLSSLTDPRAAAEEACAGALDGAGRADAALVLTGPGYGDALPALLDAVRGTLGTAAVAGASGHGVIGAGRECEGSPAVAVLAVSGLEARPFLIHDPAGEERAACAEIAAQLEGAPRPEDLVVLFPDPRSLDVAALLAESREMLGPARVVGAGAGEPLSGNPLQWCGSEIASGAIAGMVFRSERPVRIGVTQACRPVTELLMVTRSRGHWVLELDGRPALDVYREVAQGPLARDLARAASFLLVALPVDPELKTLNPGSYLVRHVMGFDQDENAFAIPESVSTGSRLAFALREPGVAREDLKAMLDQVAGPAALGLYLNCCARGSAFFGMQGLESAYLERALGQTALVGIFGSCEIGPIGDATELLTYTAVLALLEGT